MAKFLIHGVSATGDVKRFWYNNMTSELTNEDGSALQINPATRRIFGTEEAYIVGPSTPGKKVTPKVLKIQLGLSCNYECSYCNQRFVPHADETNPDDIQGFLDGLDSWVKSPPDKIEFWGGEPFVYIKTMKPLAEKLREKFPDSVFSVITNGSLLNPEINAWLDNLGFVVCVSHDGPGQHVRGPDPLEDPESRAGIMDLYARLKGTGRMSFNSMIHAENMDREAINEFFVKITGDDKVHIGEGAFIDPYDDGALQESLNNRSEHLYLRRRTLENIRSMKAVNMSIVPQRIQEWWDSFYHKRNANTLGQKCGMDKKDNIAVDLKGNVLTCQNVSHVATSFNGESHLLGNVSDFDNIELKTAKHWSFREECPNCPVLQVCKGSCMFLEGEHWKRACDNSYSDHIGFFAAAIDAVTWYLPYKIEHEALPENRQDIFGKEDEQAAPRKRFPIPVVAG